MHEIYSFQYPFYSVQLMNQHPRGALLMRLYDCNSAQDYMLVFHVVCLICVALLLRLCLDDDYNNAYKILVLNNQLNKICLPTGSPFQNVSGCVNIQVTNDIKIMNRLYYW